MSHQSLQVTVVEGRHLKDKDVFGPNDAYVELYLDKDYRQRTSTVKENSSPVWNETFNFNLLKDQDHLHVKAFDEDLIGKDSIGSTKISLKKIEEAGGRLDEWVKLPAHLGLGSHGEVHLILQLS